MHIFTSRLLQSTVMSLALLPLSAHAEDKVPQAMKIPVDSTTTPAATTNRDLAPTSGANNSGRNEVHNGKNAVTADQQSNDKNDVEITRKIRQDLIKDKSLSMAAHNVKIITVQGRVVLKGPVSSNEEKQKVESSAKRIAGMDKVVSEIELQAK